MKDTYKKAMCIAACVLGVSLVSWTTWRLLPSSADEMRRCAVVVSATSWYEVTVDGKPLLYFAESDADSAVYNVTTDRKKALHRSFSTGVWTNDWLLMPSCKGRLVTISHAPSDVLRGSADSTIIRLCREAVTARLRDINKQKSELNYYMRVHNVQDYGYQEVAALDTRVNRAYTEAERVLQLIDSITDGNHGVFVKTHHEYTAIYRSAEGKLVRTPLRLVDRRRQDTGGCSGGEYAAVEHGRQLRSTRRGFPHYRRGGHGVRHGVGTNSANAGGARQKV